VSGWVGRVSPITVTSVFDAACWLSSSCDGCSIVLPMKGEFAKVDSPVCGLSTLPNALPILTTWSVLVILSPSPPTRNKGIFKLAHTSNPANPLSGVDPLRDGRAPHAILRQTPVWL